MTGTVMITTGGTGGHVFPGLAVAARLIARGWKVFWLGTRDGIESRLVPANGVEFESIRFGGVRGKGLRQTILGPFELLKSMVQSYQVIRRRRPDVVLALGGFVSFPGAAMALVCRKPLAIHDANAVAGLANRVLAFGAQRVLLGFPDAFHGKHAAKTEWVGNPVSEAIAGVAAPEQRFATRSGALHLLVVGGSLGATVLNERVPAALALLPREARPIVTHQSGEKHLDAARTAYANAGVDAECLPFIPDIARRYAEADLVICRGGALTVSELAAVGVASIIVPLPGAIADEQSQNADFLVRAGGAIVIAQAALTPEKLAEVLREYSRDKLYAMSVAAHRVGRTDAAERVATACIELGSGVSA